MIHTARAGSYRGGGGYVRIDDPANDAVSEFETLTCSHCSAVRIKNPHRTRPRERCPRCSRYICDPCGKLYHATGQCLGTQEMLELAQAHPGQGPFLARGPNKEPLFDPRLQDMRRVW